LKTHCVGFDVLTGFGVLEGLGVLTGLFVLKGLGVLKGLCVLMIGFLRKQVDRRNDGEYCNK
jgi:hypothetical protein